MDQTPTDILSRERLVLQKNYTSTMVSPFMTVVSPFSWVSTTANEGCLSTFRYLRFKAIKYRVIVQTNPFIYGYFALTCLPDDTRRHNNVGAISDYGWFSHDDCLIVDLTSMPESTITVPWLSPNTWIDLNKWTAVSPEGLNIDELYGLKIIYDNTIGSTDSSIPKTFSISVFIEVVNPEVCCPISPAASMRTMRHEAQMFNAAASVAGGFVFDAVKKHAQKTVEEKVGEFGQAASQFFSTEGETSVFGETSEQPADPTIVTNDVDNGQPTPAEVVPSVFGGMNYSCSRNVLGTGSLLLPRGNCTHNSISEFLQKPSLVGRFTFITGTDPVYSAPVYTGTEFDTFSNDPGCSRIRFLANFFRMYRGSITYTFMFIASPMQTFRVKIGLDYQGGTLATTAPGDTLQQVITVRGTTVHQVTVPYLYTLPWRAIKAVEGSGQDIMPQLTVSEFSPASKSGDTVPSFYMLVYESANRDFVFASQQEPMPFAQTPAKIKIRHTAQMDIRKFRSQEVVQFGSIPHVPYPSDNVQTFEAMAKRWSARGDFNLNPTPVYHASPLQSDPDVSTMSTFDAIAGLFMWSRGQVKFKISFDADPTTINPSAMGIMKMASFQEVTNSVDSGTAAAVRFCDGSHAISYGLTQVIEVTVPFLCTAEWVGTLSTPSNYVAAQSYFYEPELWSEGEPVVPLNFVAISAGRDYCYSYNLPPPYWGARWYDCVPYTPDVKSPNTATVTSPQNARVRGVENRKILPRG